MSNNTAWRWRRFTQLITCATGVDVEAQVARLQRLGLCASVHRGDPRVIVNDLCPRRKFSIAPRNAWRQMVGEGAA